MGIKACYISGEQDNDYVKESVLKGDYQVVYFTPEMILTLSLSYFIGERLSENYF